MRRRSTRCSVEAHRARSWLSTLAIGVPGSADSRSARLFAWPHSAAKARNDCTTMLCPVGDLAASPIAERSRKADRCHSLHRALRDDGRHRLAIDLLTPCRWASGSRRSLRPIPCRCASSTLSGRRHDLRSLLSSLSNVRSAVSSAALWKLVEKIWGPSDRRRWRRDRLLSPLSAPL
jgi:hypothetical protein